ncbi:MAG TPA: phenylacetate-CoA oxygenase subunit PaaC [Flavilitoribacter sp.]|nr:phenylacetate-CoA oxygenase subunit PaaC [Flavilitoribacter sp.]
MVPSTHLYDYLLRLGDNALILGQRLGEWCGHGPVLEQDIALTNIALDLIGQARLWLEYAAQTAGKGQTEDNLAFLRDAGAFRNALLVEQPNGDFAHTIIRQFLFDAWNFALHEDLCNSGDLQIRAIAEKSLKEIAYHRKYSSEWTIRLGDGTEESRSRMQTALEDLWTYTGELWTPDDLDREMAEAGISPPL